MLNDTCVSVCFASFWASEKVNTALKTNGTQMIIIHQDLWSGKLVSSPYKSRKLSNRVFCTFSSRKEIICKWIPISNSLGEEITLVSVSISKGGLKHQRVMLSDMPKLRVGVGTNILRMFSECALQICVKFFSEIPTLVVQERQS